MSQSQMAVAAHPGSTSDEPTRLTSQESVQCVLDALEDADCRRLLEATREDALTVNELSEQCGLPLSTTYRKIDVLSDADLLDEDLRIRRSGKHVSEYRCAVEDVTVSLCTDGGVELSVSHREPDDTHPLAAAFTQ